MPQQRPPTDPPAPSVNEPHNLAALVSHVHEKLSEKEAAEAAVRPPPVTARPKPAAPSPRTPRLKGLSEVAPGIIKWGLAIVVILVVTVTQLPKLLPHSQAFIREELAIVLYRTRAEVELHRDKYGHVSNYRPRTSIQLPSLGTVYLHYQLLDNGDYRLIAVSDQGEKMAVATEGLAFPVAH
ncbi:MAG: hypothetical protein QG599_2847 [Pseudomonadota bacterium]|nr:hypothetical protein [Pseudomonadota bacterium]